MDDFKKLPECICRVDQQQISLQPPGSGSKEKRKYSVRLLQNVVELDQALGVCWGNNLPTRNRIKKNANN